MTAGTASNWLIMNSGTVSGTKSILLHICTCSLVRTLKVNLRLLKDLEKQREGRNKNRLPSSNSPKCWLCRYSRSLMKPLRGVAQPSARTCTHWRSNYENNRNKVAWGEEYQPRSQGKKSWERGWRNMRPFVNERTRNFELRILMPRRVLLLAVVRIGVFTPK